MREVFVSTKSLEIETTGNIVELLANRDRIMGWKTRNGG